MVKMSSNFNVWYGMVFALIYILSEKACGVKHSLPRLQLHVSESATSIEIGILCNKKLIKNIYLPLWPRNAVNRWEKNRTAHTLSILGGQLHTVQMLQWRLCQNSIVLYHEQMCKTFRTEKEAARALAINFSRYVL